MTFWVAQLLRIYLMGFNFWWWWSWAFLSQFMLYCTFYTVWSLFISFVFRIISWAWVHTPSSFLSASSRIHQYWAFSQSIWCYCLSNWSYLAASSSIFVIAIASFASIATPCLLSFIPLSILLVRACQMASVRPVLDSRFTI